MQRPGRTDRVLSSHTDQVRIAVYPTHYIFNHFPKTGGTSLVSVCRANLDAAEISPPLMEDDIRVMPAGFERYKLINGHFFVFTQACFCRSRYSMTLVRDPIRRIVSSYAFWRKSTDRNLLTTTAKELPFSDFVHYFIESPMINNNYSHFFAAVGRDCTGYPADAAARLAAAKCNLAAFDFVGITEEFERSVRLLCNELGWRVPDSIPFENRSGSEAILDDIDPQTMEILQERNQLDLELHRYATSLFHKREAAMASGAPSPAGQHIQPNPLVSFPLPRQLNRRVVIQSVSASWAPDESSGLLEIAVDFTTKTLIAELSLDMQVHDVFGNLVWTANTTNEFLDLEWQIDCNTHAVFVLECGLPQGIYLVTVGLYDPRRFGFHEHWIDRAAIFEVEFPLPSQSPRVKGVQLQKFSSTVASPLPG